MNIQGTIAFTVTGTADKLIADVTTSHVLST